MKSDSILLSPTSFQTQYYQEVLPKPAFTLNALEVAKWGFIELVLIVIIGRLLRELNRQRQSKSST